jgi:hypothetical protein
MKTNMGEKKDNKQTKTKKTTAPLGCCNEKYRSFLRPLLDVNIKP